jgi:hypothetical protein
MTSAIYRSGVRVEGGLRLPTAAWEQLPFVIGLLRSFSEEPVAQKWADALERFAVEGGNLQDQIGLKLPSGGAYQRPGRVNAKAQRDRRLRQLARSLGGKPTAAAGEVSRLLRERDPRVAVFLQQYPDTPTSISQIKRIVREV